MEFAINDLINSLSTLNLHNQDDRNQAMNQISRLVNDTTVSRTTVHKAPKPQFFNGGRNALATRDWLDEVERYCKRTGIPKNEWTSIAVDYLRGTASTWFRLSGLKESEEWEDFKTSFTQEFRPSNHNELVSAQLRDLRQKSVMDITSYINKFRELALQLDNPSDNYLRDLFITGLVTDTQIQVQLDNPKTWQEAIQVAERVNNVYARALSKSRPTVTTPSPTATVLTANPATPHPQVSTSGGPEPMDLDSIRVMLSNLTALVNGTTTLANINQGNHRSVNRSRLAKMDRAEKERCLRLKLCFRCRKPGHIAEECRGTALHDIETTNSLTESGKAKGDL